MAKLFSMHPSDDQLDLYLLRHLSPEDERFLEEHYLICPECLDRLSDLQEFIAVLRAVRLESQHPLVRRKPAARLGAILLVAAGTALVCDAPAPSIITSLPDQLLMYVRPSAVVRFVNSRPRLNERSRSLRTFHPPAEQPRPLIADVALELPSDSIIPEGWIGERGFILTAEQLGPDPLPRFEAKPRWLRRAMLAVRRTFEPSRW